jgi:hypothetical protein
MSLVGFGGWGRGYGFLGGVGGVEGGEDEWLEWVGYGGLFPEKGWGGSPVFQPIKEK